MRPETPLLLWQQAWRCSRGGGGRRDWAEAPARGCADGSRARASATAVGRAQLAHAARSAIPRAALQRTARRIHAAAGSAPGRDTWLWRFGDVYLDASGKSTSRKFPSTRCPAARLRFARGARPRRADLSTTTTTRSRCRASRTPAFRQIARERTARHPLRTWLEIPLLRSLTLWFTPRVELLPLSGHLWPLRRRMGGRSPRFSGDPAASRGELRSTSCSRWRVRGSRAGVRVGIL